MPIAALREKARLSQTPYLRAFASMRVESFVDLAKHRVGLFEHGLIWESQDSIASLAQIGIAVLVQACCEELS